MSRCYSVDHIAGDLIHIDTTTCNINEPQQKYALDRPIKDYWGGGGLIYVLLASTSDPLYVYNNNKSTTPVNAEKYFMTHRGNRTHDLGNTA